MREVNILTADQQMPHSLATFHSSLLPQILKKGLSDPLSSWLPNCSVPVVYAPEQTTAQSPGTCGGDLIWKSVLCRCSQEEVILQ